MNIIRQVASLKPGFEIKIDRNELADEIGGRHYNGAYFTPADNILENIIGGSYEYGYDIIPKSGDVIFYRLDKPLENGRTYTSPDRR